VRAVCGFAGVSGGWRSVRLVRSLMTASGSAALRVPAVVYGRGGGAIRPALSRSRSAMPASQSEAAVDGGQLNGPFGPIQSMALTQWCPDVKQVETANGFHYNMALWLVKYPRA